MEFDSGVLQRGEKKFIYQANIKNSILMKLTPPGGIWQTDKLALLHSNEKMKTTTQLSVVDNYSRSVNILFEYCFNGAAFREALIYCPYWLINKTQLSLSLKHVGEGAIAGLDYFNQGGSQQPLMFSFADNAKKKLELAVHNSNILSEASIP